MTTSVAIAVGQSRQPSDDASGRRDRSAPSRSRTLGWVAVVGVLAIALGGLLAVAGLGGLGRSSGSPAPSAGVKATTSVTPSTSPGPSTGPSPSPTADRFAPAVSRLADLRDAIAAASGGHGIKGREANELQALLVNEQGALDSRDGGTARATADQLLQAIKNDIESDRIDKAQAQALIDAAQALRKVVAGL